MESEIELIEMKEHKINYFFFFFHFGDQGREEGAKQYVDID